MVLAFESVDEIRKCDHSNKNNEAVLSCVVVFFMMYKVVLTFEPVNEIVKCDYSHKSY